MDVYSYYEKPNTWNIFSCFKKSKSKIGQKKMHSNDIVKTIFVLKIKPTQNNFYPEKAIGRSKLLVRVQILNREIGFGYRLAYVIQS